MKRNLNQKRINESGYSIRTKELIETQKELIESLKREIEELKSEKS
jgi:hypothetical protein